MDKDADSAFASEEAGEAITLQNGQLLAAYRDWSEVPAYLGDRYGALTKRFDLSQNCLSTLANMDKFGELQELILDGNYLNDNLVFPCELPHLETLSLNKNQLTDLESLLAEIKRAAPNLRFLSLLGNTACPNELVDKEEDDYHRYRLMVIFHLPNLKFLDSRPVTAAETSEAKSKGSFLKVVRVSSDYASQPTSPTKPAAFSPLPSGDDFSQPKSSMHRCKYVYYGRHSEGNRFIRNNDL